MRLSSHEGGGGWPGGVGGLPPGLFGGAASMFGDGSYSGNVIQGGSVLQPQPCQRTGVNAIPAMAGLTNGAFVVSASTQLDDAQYSLWHAANKATGSATGSNTWHASGGNQNDWWKVDCGVELTIGAYFVQAMTDYLSRSPSGWVFQGSHDNAAWDTLDTRSGFGSWGSAEKKQYTLAAPVTYRWYRWSNLNSIDLALVAVDEFGLLPVTTFTNTLVVTGAATVAPDAATGASVVMCDTCIVDGGSLKPAANSKGLIIIAKTGIYTVNGGTISASNLGKAGNFGNLTLWSLIPASLQRKLKQDALAAYILVGEGAAGGPGTIPAGSFNPGSAATLPLQSGGGGSGGTYGIQGSSGGKGGPCSGGGGGGGNGYPSLPGANAPDYGPGGNARTGNQSNCNNAGGAGDPIGANESPPCGSVSPAPGAGGAPLFLLSPIVNIASGTVVQSDGSRGGDCVGVGGGYSMAGGGAGGGPVGIVTRPGGYTNNGTVRADGGAGGNVTGASGNYCGGPGGAGSVNIFTAA